MNLRIIFWLLAVAAVAAVVWDSYEKGYKNGRVDLLAQQAKAAKKIQDEQATRQHANDSKAAAAESEGAAKTVTITRDVIKYVKSPNRTVCEFPSERVQLKSRAVDNANNIAGFDDTAVQATSTGK